MAKRWTSFVIGTDIHGDKQDKVACDAFFKFVEQWKPDKRLILGDLWDFAALRRKASEDEKRESLALDFQMGKQFAERFQPDYFLMGNHDARLVDAAESGVGIIRDYATQGLGEIDKLMKSMRTKVLPYHKRDGVHRLGRLICIHGFTAGAYAARAAALAYGSDVIMGHVHTNSIFSLPGHPVPRVGMSIGALCELDFPYNRATLQSLSHEHGWAAGVYNEKTGDFHVWLAKKVGSRWFIPTLGEL